MKGTLLQGFCQIPTNEWVIIGILSAVFILFTDFVCGNQIVGNIYCLTVSGQVLETSKFHKYFRVTKKDNVDLTSDLYIQFYRVSVKVTCISGEIITDTKTSGMKTTKKTGPWNKVLDLLVSTQIKYFK